MASSLKTLAIAHIIHRAGQAPFTHPKKPVRDASTVITATDRPAREIITEKGS